TDSPGLLEPEYQLHETMRAAALRAIADAEVIAYLHPLAEFPAPPLTEVAKLDRAPRAPIVTVYTKSDVASTSPNLPQPTPPYSVAVEIDEFREGQEPVYIRAVVYVERASQKGIVIGEGGRTIKAIGQTARGKIEVLLGARVFLELHAKVLPKWRRQLASLKR